jgi:hypothetical protein
MSKNYLNIHIWSSKSIVGDKIQVLHQRVGGDHIKKKKKVVKTQI